jgi:hypothetical protein
VTVSLTYDGNLSRVRISATSLSAAADYALFERSTDQIRWTTVRGGAEVAITANAAALDDYEFSPDVVNYYRVSAIDTTQTIIGTGTASHAVNASVSPGIPAGVVAGEVLLMLAAIRNSGTGTVDTVSGWTSLVNFGNMRLFGKIAGASESAPTVTFTGGAANQDTSAQIAALRGATLTVHNSATQLNGSAQNIAYPALALTTAPTWLVFAGWKQDNWTGVTSPHTELGEPSTATGDNQGITWATTVATGEGTMPADVFTVTGGISAISRAITIALEIEPFTISAETQSITPTLDTVWVKSISRPFLNRPITVVDVSEIGRPARNGVFDVVGRSFPVAVTDVRGSRRYALTAFTETTEAAEAVDLILASGDPVFIHVPAAQNIPGGYVVIGDTSETRFGGQDPRLFEMPMIEVAPPGPDVVGATVEWQSIINDFATWADVIAEFATWADVLEYVGSPSDVIVP